MQGRDLFEEVEVGEGLSQPGMLRAAQDESLETSGLRDSMGFATSPLVSWEDHTLGLII